MRVLVVNAGSSSLKHALVHAGRGAILAHGEQRWEPGASAGRHAGALAAALADAGGGADAVGHRVVHGGARFTGPAVIGADVRAAIEALAPLAPLHTRAALEGIDAAAAALPRLAQVACFDTAFHRTLAPEAATYALPREWSERFGLRRYGFHGLNVAWCHEQASARLGCDGCRRLVVCHLGSGCSVSAVLDGRSVDTTMGFTPLEGVPMATRSGSVDPGLLLHLLAAGIGREELDDALNHRSGLLGLSGRHGLRDVERAAVAGDPRARLAFDVLVRGVSGAVAAMSTSLLGLDALVFTAGAGERSALLRGAICERLGQLGVVLDDDANAADAQGISRAGAAVAVLVVAAGEEIVIARETARALGRSS
ncbi:MAG: acetate/propionate family kinase [Solirubrobacteraceae bacterium]|nr:acetate/propionate family kinase [Solirubrobacteraceae bacterium]